MILFRRTFKCKGNGNLKNPLGNNYFCRKPIWFNKQTIESFCIRRWGPKLSIWHSSSAFVFFLVKIYVRTWFLTSPANRAPNNFLKLIIRASIILFLLRRRKVCRYLNKKAIAPKFFEETVPFEDGGSFQNRRWVLKVQVPHTILLLTQHRPFFLF